MKTKKKLFISKNARIFTNFGVKPQKKGSLLQNLQKKQFLLTNFGVITIRESQASNCTSVAPSLLLSLKSNPCLGGIVLVWWAQAVIWGSMAPECSPWRRACCKFTAIYRTVTIAFSLKRYCSKSVLLKK